MVRGRARAEFSLRVKTTYTCPSLRPKASIFTQDTHVDAVAVTFLTVKKIIIIITCLRIWTTIITTPSIFMAL